MRQSLQKQEPNNKSIFQQLAEEISNWLVNVRWILQGIFWQPRSEPFSHNEAQISEQEQDPFDLDKDLGGPSGGGSARRSTGQDMEDFYVPWPLKVAPVQKTQSRPPIAFPPEPKGAAGEGIEIIELFAGLRTAT